MASRPIFIATGDLADPVRIVQISFDWHSGMAKSQKIKNRDALHASAREIGIYPVLEVSSKSQRSEGQRLSAFALSVRMPDGRHIPLESAFQGSKSFSGFSDCTDLYALEPREAKRIANERDRGDLEAFQFGGERWPLEPKTLFYDWLYIGALVDSADDAHVILTSYHAFSDIEFNPKRSFNCQARSCALASTLQRVGKFDEALKSAEHFHALIAPSGNWAKSLSQQLGF